MCTKQSFCENRKAVLAVKFINEPKKLRGQMLHCHPNGIRQTWPHYPIHMVVKVLGLTSRQVFLWHSVQIWMSNWSRTLRVVCACEQSKGISTLCSQVRCDIFYNGIFDVRYDTVCSGSYFSATSNGSPCRCGITQGMCVFTHILLEPCDPTTVNEGSRESKLPIRCNAKWSHQHVLWELSNFCVVLRS
jgi:hypothetical protein